MASSTVSSINLEYGTNSRTTQETPANAIETYNELDVLGGHGERTHLGNVLFRKTVYSYADKYGSADRFGKDRMARAVMKSVTTTGGRFLKPIKGSNKFVPMTESEILEKIKASIRDQVRNLKKKQKEGIVPTPPTVPVMNVSLPAAVDAAQQAQRQAAIDADFKFPTRLNALTGINSSSTVQRTRGEEKLGSIFHFNPAATNNGGEDLPPEWMEKAIASLDASVVATAAVASSDPVPTKPPPRSSVLDPSAPPLPSVAEGVPSASEPRKMTKNFGNPTKLGGSAVRMSTGSQLLSSAGSQLSIDMDDMSGQFSLMSMEVGGFEKPANRPPNAVVSNGNRSPQNRRNFMTASDHSWIPKTITSVDPNDPGKVAEARQIARNFHNPLRFGNSQTGSMLCSGGSQLTVEMEDAIGNYSMASMDAGGFEKLLPRPEAAMSRQPSDPVFQKPVSTDITDKNSAREGGMERIAEDYLTDPSTFPLDLQAFSAADLEPRPLPKNFTHQGTDNAIMASINSQITLDLDEQVPSQDSAEARIREV